jgi:hypothetical protein
MKNILLILPIFLMISTSCSTLKNKEMQKKQVTLSFNWETPFEKYVSISRDIALSSNGEIEKTSVITYYDMEAKTKSDSIIEVNCIPNSTSVFTSNKAFDKKDIASIAIGFQDLGLNYLVTSDGKYIGFENDENIINEAIQKLCYAMDISDLKNALSISDEANLSQAIKTWKKDEWNMLIGYWNNNVYELDKEYVSDYSIKVGSENINGKKKVVIRKSTLDGLYIANINIHGIKENHITFNSNYYLYTSLNLVPYQLEITQEISDEKASKKYSIRYELTYKEARSEAGKRLRVKAVD